MDSKTVGRELDSLDLQLLAALLRGALGPTDLHVIRRLDRLEAEGYAESVANSDATSSRVYTISEIGRQMAGRSD